MRQEVVIDPRFNGPPSTANGGYACGVVAAAVGACATASLRLPPPLGVPLVLEGAEDGSARLLDGDALVAEARPGAPAVEPPRPPSVEEAVEASSRFTGFERHAFPTCFVCGPDRERRDGLAIFPGPLGGDGVLGCPWIPGDDLAGEGGRVDPLFVWSALDCPSGFAIMDPDRPSVLASMTARVDEPLLAGRTYVVTGWKLSSEGRKHRSASAISDAAGRTLALAEALWITLR